MHAKNREFIQRDLENLDLTLEDIQLRNGVTHAQVRNAASTREYSINLRARNDIQMRKKRQEALRREILELEAEIESIKPHLHDYRYKR